MNFRSKLPGSCVGTSNKGASYIFAKSGWWFEWHHVSQYIVHLDQMFFVGGAQIDLGLHMYNVHVMHIIIVADTLFHCILLV